jgi:hypothetical protein
MRGRPDRIEEWHQSHPYKIQEYAGRSEQTIAASSAPSRRGPRPRGTSSELRRNKYGDAMLVGCLVHLAEARR